MSTTAAWFLGAAIAASTLACTRSPAPAPPPDTARTFDASATPDGPRVLGDHLAIWGLAIRGGHLFVNVGGERIARIPTRGGSLVEIAVSGDDRRSIGAMVFDDRAMYFAQFETGLFRVPHAGGRPTTILADPRRIAALSLVGDDLVWSINPKVLHGPPEGRIETMKATGGPITTLATGLQLASAWASDESRVYFGNGERVMSLGTSGGEPALIAEGQQNTTVIVHDGARLFWAKSPYGDHGIADSHVMSAPLRGGAATTVAEISGGVVAMAVDAENLYLGTVVIGNAEGQSAVVRIAKSGGTLVQLAEMRSIAGLVLDDRHIYYGSDPGGNEGTLHSIAKEP